jgi:3-carboxy-cis,cis-muconate cycloisomerase
MLTAETALARVEARLGLIPQEAAEAIEAWCRGGHVTSEDLSTAGRASGNPVVPLAAALRDAAGEWAHHGATSQDILDTAAMLVARHAIALICTELDGAAAACAGLAERHRATPMAARTLMQQAVPTTFGAKAAGWLVAIVESRARLAALRFSVQLGGAAGTLAVLGDRGTDVLAAFAQELGLAEPVVPWHAQRGNVAAIAAAADAAAGACAKVGLDVLLLAQTEVAEVAEADGGVSSTMPHKQNATRATLARACARIVHADAALLTGGEYEHERAAGAWHAEWGPLSRALAYTGGAAAAARECLAGLDVDVARMRANMTESLYSERERIDGEGEYLGSAAAFVDRGLAAYRESR